MPLEYVIFGVIVSPGIGASIIGMRRRRADLLASQDASLMGYGSSSTADGQTHVGDSGHDGGFHGGLDGGGSHDGGSHHGGGGDGHHH